MSYYVWLPATSFIVSTVFAVLVFQRYLRRRGTHLLFWVLAWFFTLSVSLLKRSTGRLVETP